METHHSIAFKAVSSFLHPLKTAADRPLVFLPKNVAEDNAEDLSRFGTEVISQKVFNLVSDAERNIPYVRGTAAVSPNLLAHPNLSNLSNYWDSAISFDDNF